MKKLNDLKILANEKYKAQKYEEAMAEYLYVALSFYVDRRRAE